VEREFYNIYRACHVAKVYRVKRAIVLCKAAVSDYVKGTSCCARSVRMLIFLPYLHPVMPRVKKETAKGKKNQQKPPTASDIEQAN